MKPGIYLAFPGMGKTPAAKACPGMIDLDLGHLRRADELSLANSRNLLQTYARLAEIYRDEGWAVFCNDPVIINWIHVDRMFLPKYAKYSVAKLAKTMGASPAQVNEWICDWAAVARRHGVPITEIGCGLDEYLISLKE